MPDSPSKLRKPLPVPLPAVHLPAEEVASATSRPLRAAPGGYLAVKPAVDFVLAAALLVLTAPVTLLAMALVKLTSRGPVFYTQVRLGRHGRPYVIFKLRTMYLDCEAGTGPVWAKEGDPRITPLGRLLRATHIDEFPQLLNVMLGDMSLTGPRPERPEIVEYLKSKIPGYADRLQFRPGITGLAQVQLPPDVNLEGVRKKLVCDLHYIEHFSGWLDWRILICTGLFLLGVPLALTRRVLCIPEPLKG